MQGCPQTIPDGTSSTLVDHPLLQVLRCVVVGILHPLYLPGYGTEWVAHGHRRGLAWQEDSLEEEEEEEEEGRRREEEGKGSGEGRRVRSQERGEGKGGGKEDSQITA